MSAEHRPPTSPTARVGDWARQRWHHWLVAGACWFAGLVCWGATWASEYPDVDALPGPLQEEVVSWMSLDAVLGLLACLVLPLVTRMARPSPRRGVLCLALLAVAGWSIWALPATMVVLVVVGSWLAGRWTAGALAVTLAAGMGAERFAPSQEKLGLVEMVLGGVAFMAVPVLLGRVLGNRRSLMAAYRQRAESAERERDQTIARVRAEERQAIARDMHDGLSHRLSLVALHAGALSYRDDLGPEQVRETATTIQANVHEAAEELRQVLTVLRSAEDAPRPLGIDQVEQVIADGPTGGSRVSLHVADGIALDRLSSLASVALARTVAEGLANAVKHAPDSPVDVDVREQDGGVLVQVTTQLSEPVEHSLPGGYGLVGLQERLAAARGWLRAEADPTDFRLRAWVPW